MTSDNFSKKFDAQNELGEMGEKVVPLLIEALQDIDQRVGAGGALEKIGKPAVKPLLNSLNDTEWRVRFVAAHTLGHIRAKEAVEPLIGLLYDPQPEVRKYAAEALGSIGDQRAEQPLRERLQYEDSMLAISGINEALSNLRTNITTADTTADEDKQKQIHVDAENQNTQKKRADIQNTSDVSKQTTSNASEKNASDESKQNESNVSGQKTSKQISKKKAVIMIAAIAAIAVAAVVAFVLMLGQEGDSEVAAGAQKSSWGAQVSEAPYASEEAAAPDGEPTPQSLQVSDIIGIWQLGDFVGEEFVVRDEFIEFTETEMVNLQDGTREPYTLENSDMVLYDTDYFTALADDVGVLVWGSVEAGAGPAFFAKRPGEEATTAHVAAPKVTDSVVLTNKEWDYIEHVVTPGADVDKMPLYECKNIWFSEDGTFRTSRSKGTYEVKDDTLILFFTSAGQRHIFYITTDKQESEGIYNMTLTSEDKKAAFSFRAYEKE